MTSIVRVRTLDDKILTAIYSGKDQQVLNLLYKEVLPGIRSYVQKNNGNKEDANDIFQDTVLIFYNKVKQHQFDKQYEISAYMFSIARNLWRKRAAVKKKTISQENDFEIESDEDIIKYMITEEKMKAIKTLFEKLGEPCHTLLTYSIFECMSMQDIVDKLHYKTINVAKTYAYRCRKKLAALMKSKKGFLQLFDL